MNQSCRVRRSRSEWLGLSTVYQKTWPTPVASGPRVGTTPAGSAFANGWHARDRTVCASQPTLIEGIGRPRVEPCFLFEVVDHVVEVPDSASIAAAWMLDEQFGHRYGGSSGTNFVACLRLAAAMQERGERGSIVALLCDRGERYAETLFDPAWLMQHGIERAPWDAALRTAMRDGTWRAPTT